MQSISSMRTSAFGGASVRATPAARTGLAYKSPVAASVQDLQGTVVSTAMNKSIIVSVERLAPHDKVRRPSCRSGRGGGGGCLAAQQRAARLPPLNTAV
eukprot:366112-Chlamydomonas_euryale.AAC.29